MNCVGGAVRADRGNLSSHRNVTVRFTPPTPPRQPRLDHVGDLWQLHRPQKPQAILTAAIFRTETGYELVKRRYAGVEGSTNVPRSVLQRARVARKAPRQPATFAHALSMGVETAPVAR
jgi:hypothetical protein